MTGPERAMEALRPQGPSPFRFCPISPPRTPRFAGGEAYVGLAHDVGDGAIADLRLENGLELLTEVEKDARVREAVHSRARYPDVSPMASYEPPP